MYMHENPARTEMLLTIGMRSLQVHAISSAVSLCLSDHLGDATLGLNELAERCGATPSSLRRLLLALASIGIFQEAENGFQNTNLSSTLRTDRPDTLAGWAKFMASTEMDSCFGQLSAAVKCGTPVFDKLYGMPFFEYLEKNSAYSEVFSAAMTSYTFSMVDESIAAYDFSGAVRLVDVGGGHGALLRRVLFQYPEAKGILFERPQVLAEVRAMGLAMDDRLQLCEGNFFHSVPKGADLYILRHILHDWADDEAILILSNIRKNMMPGTKLLVFEHILREANQPDFARFLDLVMLAVLRGREREHWEYEALLQKAGLKITRLISTNGFHSIIEAVAV